MRSKIEINQSAVRKTIGVNPFENIKDNAGNYSDEWLTKDAIESLFNSIEKAKSGNEQIKRKVERYLNKLSHHESIPSPKIHE